ncbi:MAG: molybdopterin-dependent oxidoreductase [Nitrososphaerota archaeon]|nr:molybdopterin-dependent oxidoreductase [Nitrososphaerota archaeon]
MVSAFAGLSALASKPPFQLEAVEAQTQTATTPTEQIIPSSCRLCASLDGILVHVVDGQPTFIEGDPKDPRSFGRVCGKGNAGVWLHYDPYRVKAPLKRTNPNKGLNETGNWVEISWEEAYSTVANKMAAARAKGAAGYVRYNDYSALSYSQTWRSFTAVAPGQNHNVQLEMNWCGHTAHYLSRQAHGAFTSAADYGRTKYLIQPGRSHGMQAGGSLMQYGLPQADARADGMHIVHLSPFLSPAAGIANEWVGIVPATEGAVGSALLEVVLLELKQYDAPFLKSSTNAPYLIGPDGMYVRDEATKKPLIWDAVDNTPKTYDDASIKDYAILGSFTVSGVSSNIYNNDTSTLTNVTAKPAFQLLVDAVTPMTPEWAEKISGAPAATIRRIANEFIAAATIGATTTIGGRTYPLRPAAVEYYGGGASNHVHGTANGMALELLNTVIGGQDAPGGHTNSGPPGLLPGPDGLIMPAAGAYTYGRPLVANKYKWQFPPVTPELKEFFPVGDHPPVPYWTMNDPTNYWGVGNHTLDFILFHAWNPMLTMFDEPKMEGIWKKAGFVAGICVWVEETAESYADVVIPDRIYLEEYQINGGVLMQPTTSPPGDIPFLHDTLSELASRAGFLTDYNTSISSSLKAPNTFDVTQKVPTETYFDLLLKSIYGADHDLAWFKQNAQGPFSKGPQKFNYQPWKYNYTPARRIPVYFENQVELMAMLKKNMDANGVQWDFRDYSPVPTWIPPPSVQSTPPYDLTMMAWLSHNASYDWSNVNPLLANIYLEEPYQPYVAMNTTDADARGIKTGDLVWVEFSIGRQQGVVKVTETVYPGVIAVNRSMAGWARNAVVKDLYKKVPNVAYMVIRPAALDLTDTLTGTLENVVKVRVYKVI